MATLVMPNVSSNCGCWNFIFHVEVGIARILDELESPITDENGMDIYTEINTNDMKISEFTTYTGGGLPEGSFIPIIIPDGGGEYTNAKIDLSGKSLAKYIDVQTDGSDTINDARINEEIMVVFYDMQSMILDYTSVTGSITSPTFLDFAAGKTIRIVFGTEKTI